MTYKNLKKYLLDNINNEIGFDLIPQGIKSKLIFAVGDGASGTAAFLSSVMNECEISHSRYIHNDGIELKYRFISSGEYISIDKLCQVAEELIKRSGKSISSDALLLSCALSMLDGADYLILEMSEQIYRQIIKHTIPFALILAMDDDITVCELTDSAPTGINEIVALTNESNYDYISNKLNKNGARITYASPNKRTISSSTVFGTDFFHYDYLYKTRAINLCNIPLAHLAIESATALFSAPRPLIRIGISKANPINDLTLYSLSPTVLFREGNDDFLLFHNMKFKIAYESDEFAIPIENTVYCGNNDFIKEIKRKLK